VVLLTIGFGLYTLIQNDVPLRAAAAIDRGRTLLELEQSWHIDLLHPLNDWLPRYKPIAVFANYYYVALHFFVPIGILIWMIRRRNDRYRAERRVFVIMSLAALAVFWFAPTAPPRLVPGSGVLDTVSYFHTIGSYDSGATQHAADEFASMPSLHFAWALWCATTMCRLAQRRWIRWAWFIYPTMTFVDILATGNHYVLDAAAGAADLGLAYVVSVTCSRLARRLDAVVIAAPASGVLDANPSGIGVARPAHPPTAVARAVHPPAVNLPHPSPAEPPIAQSD
jgi:hypothetical protein